MLSHVSGAKFIYVPFKSGGEAAVQLAGGHIDANLNNPNENIGQWKASMIRPLCIFSTERMAPGPKVTKDMGWSDIPTCKESGIPIDHYQMPRTIWLPAGTFPPTRSPTTPTCCPRSARPPSGSSTSSARRRPTPSCPATS